MTPPVQSPAATVMAAANLAQQQADSLAEDYGTGREMALLSALLLAVSVEMREGEAYADSEGRVYDGPTRIEEPSWTAAYRLSLYALRTLERPGRSPS